MKSWPKQSQAELVQATAQGRLISSHNTLDFCQATQPPKKLFSGHHLWTFAFAKLQKYSLLMMRAELSIELPVL